MIASAVSTPFVAKIGQLNSYIILTNVFIIFCSLWTCFELFFGTPKILKTYLNFIRLCGTGYRLFVCTLLNINSSSIWHIIERKNQQEEGMWRGSVEMCLTFEWTISQDMNCNNNLSCKWWLFFILKFEN